MNSTLISKIARKYLAMRRYKCVECRCANDLLEVIGEKRSLVYVRMICPKCGRKSGFAAGVKGMRKRLR